MSSITNMMKLLVACVVFAKVAHTRFLEPDYYLSQEFRPDKYDQRDPFLTLFNMKSSPRYLPIAYDQSGYPTYTYSNLESPFSRKYRPNWFFRTRFCWPLNKDTTTDRSVRTTPEGIITTEKGQNAEGNTFGIEEKTATDRSVGTTPESIITTEKGKNAEGNTTNVEEKTVNLFTTETPTTVGQVTEISRHSTTAANKNSTKKQEESTTSNVENNIIPIDYDVPKAE